MSNQNKAERGRKVATILAVTTAGILGIVGPADAGTVTRYMLVSELHGTPTYGGGVIAPPNAGGGLWDCSNPNACKFVTK